MTCTIHKMKLGLYACLCKKFMEMLALAYRNHIVCGSVEDYDRRIGRIDVCRSVESLESLFVALESEAHHSLFRSMIPVIDLTAAAHEMKVGRA